MFRALSDCNRWGSRHGRDTRQAHGVSNHIHTPSALCRIHPAPISRRGESAASQLELLCVCVCRVHALSLSLSSMLSAQNSTAQLRALVGSHCDTVVASQVTCQARCTELLKSITSNGDLFFSTTYDLTSTTQQQALMVCMFGLFGCACVYVAFRLPSCIETHTHTLSLTHTLSVSALFSPRITRPIQQGHGWLERERQTDRERGSVCVRERVCVCVCSPLIAPNMLPLSPTKTPPSAADVRRCERMSVRNGRRRRANAPQ